MSHLSPSVDDERPLSAGGRASTSFMMSEVQTAVDPTLMIRDKARRIVIAHVLIPKLKTLKEMQSMGKAYINQEELFTIDIAGDGNSPSVSFQTSQGGSMEKKEENVLKPPHSPQEDDEQNDDEEFSSSKKTRKSVAGATPHRDRRDVPTSAAAAAIVRRGTHPR